MYLCKIGNDIFQLMLHTIEKPSYVRLWCTVSLASYGGILPVQHRHVLRCHPHLGS